MRRRWVGAIGLGAAAAATASVFACQQLVGIPGDPPVPTAVSACGLPYGNNACASCAATSCCTESSACAADAVCSAFEACLGKSNGDWQLRSQCAIDNPVGDSIAVSPLSACLATRCVNECGLTCGALAANYTTPDHAAPCQQCVAGSSSCAPEQACAASETCDALFRCKVACATLDCIDGCLSVYDAGADALASFIQVFHGTCSAPCAFGQDWTCVGHVSWPSSKSDTTTFTVDVQDYTSLLAVSGAEVDVCDSTDVNCTDPLAKGQTNDAGEAVMMHVPNQEQVGGLGLNGYLQITASGYLPEFYYWGFPLSESEFELSYNAFFLDGVQLIKPADLQNDGLVLRIQVDAGLGVVTSVVPDCKYHPAPGVTLTTSVSGLHAVYGKSSVAMATDSTAFVTFFNVPAGSLDLEAFPSQLGGKPSSRETVIVRAGSVTVVSMVPTP